MLLRNFSIEQMIERMILVLPVLIIALTIHELSHGLVAYKLGDSTAKQDGRLSLNPIRHIDPLGLIFMIVAQFGWAKPVRVNPHNLKNPKIDMALISIAGPLSNFIMAFIGMMILFPLRHFVPNTPGYVITILQTFNIINIMLGVFNLIPVPPLDGSKVVAGLLPDSIYNSLPPVGRFGMLILMVLIITGAIAQIILPITVAIAGMLNSFVVEIYRFLL